MDSFRNPFGYIRNSRSELVVTVLLIFSFLFISLILLSQGLYIVVLILSLLFISLIIICKLCVSSNDFIRQEMLRMSDQIGLNQQFVSLEKRGLTMQEIQSIPTQTLKQELDDVCSICLSKQKQHDIIRILPCNHQYHSECIEIWLHQRSNCPICKKEVNISDLFFQC